MGRSVSHPSGAIVAFQDHSDLDADMWDWLIEAKQDTILGMFPSMCRCDKWLDREDHAIAENRFAYFGLSEYCGLVAIWLVKKDDLGRYEADHNGIADRWLAQVEPRFLKTFGQLRKLGTFSNGEGVYERV